jgi:hypothetical protein
LKDLVVTQHCWEGQRLWLTALGLNDYVTAAECSCKRVCASNFELVTLQALYCSSLEGLVVSSLLVTNLISVGGASFRLQQRMPETPPDMSCALLVLLFVAVGGFATHL